MEEVQGGVGGDSSQDEGAGGNSSALPELELGEREDDDAGKKAQEVEGGEGGGGDSTQDDKGATQSTRELPELEPGAHDTRSKDGKKLEMQGGKDGYSRNRQVTSQSRLNGQN